MRQLVLLRLDGRSNPAAAPMRQEASHLTLKNVNDAAAYAASRAMRVYTVTAAPVFDTLARYRAGHGANVFVSRWRRGKPGIGTFAVTPVWRHLPEGWWIVYGHESWAKPPG